MPNLHCSSIYCQVVLPTGRAVLFPAHNKDFIMNNDNCTIEGLPKQLNILLKTIIDNNMEYL